MWHIPLNLRDLDFLSVMALTAGAHSNEGYSR